MTDTHASCSFQYVLRPAALLSAVVIEKAPRRVVHSM
jgi:hypothetical protein